MKIHFKKAFFLLISFLTTTILKAQSENSYEIYGKLKGMQDGGTVKMYLFNSKAYHAYWKYFTTPDSAVIKNGEFHLKGTVPEGPRRYWLTISKYSSVSQDISKTIELWISNGEKVTLTSDQPLDSINHGFIEHYVTITGSPTTESKMRLDPLYEYYSGCLDGVLVSLRKVQDSIGFNPAIVENILSFRQLDNYLLYRFILWPEGVDPDKTRARMFFLNLFNNTGHAPFWVTFYNSLSVNEKNTFNGKWLKELIPITVGEFSFLQLPIKITTTREMNLKYLIINKFSLLFAKYFP